MEHKLTPDEWKIYNYLKDHTGEWVPQEHLALDLFGDELYKEGYAYYANFNFHNSNVRKKLTNAIRNLNNSSVIQKIILSSSKGVKIADKDEIDNYIGRQINSVIKRLNRVKKIAKKASLDGQCKIIFGKYERAVIEAFPSEENKPKPKYKVGDIVYHILIRYDYEGNKLYIPQKEYIKKVYVGKTTITYYCRYAKQGIPEKHLYSTLEAVNAKIKELTCRQLAE